ncbi:hypothetical protein [Kitasatospora purpeofusca]|uniref:hypothetical protein n=1 Tax=Kitasatospora purpeofusca TaxID=67352 RepID=UPI0036571CC5
MTQPQPAECTTCYGENSSCCPDCRGTGTQPAPLGLDAIQARCDAATDGEGRDIAEHDCDCAVEAIEQLQAENERLADVGRRALASLDDLIRDHQDPGAEALGARYQLAQALTGHPHTCSNCDGIDPASCLMGAPQADLAGWSAGLAEDGLEPYDGTLTIDVGGQPFLRTHLAFSPAADERDRENFTTRLGQIILREL